jgi:hypothetical protein
VGAAGIDAFGLQGAMAGAITACFLAAHAPAFAGMGVEPGQRQVRVGNAEIARQGGGNHAAAAQDQVGGEQPCTSDSGTWTVSGTVRRLGPASIITASSSAMPQAWARNSVWPGR